jgi:DNA-binding GntR family transcriptional regulator
LSPAPAKPAAEHPHGAPATSVHISSTIAGVQFQGKADVLTAALRELIITGELEPGTPLRQRDLAARFGVSPTPVREALRRLQAEGLVDHDLHRGASVIEAEVGAGDEAYQVRAVLESLAARIAAARATDEDLVELRRLQAKFAACSLDDPELLECNRQFHFRIYEASRSPILLALLRLLWQAFQQRPQRLRPLTESVADHEAILDALERGDEDTVEQHTLRHILRPVDQPLAHGS